MSRANKGTNNYRKIKSQLEVAYDKKVDERSASDAQPWKVDVRQKFLDLIQAEQKRSLLEIGAGTGLHAEFFVNSGLDVLATDLSSAMVTACQRRGLTAQQSDFFCESVADTSFDSVFALNCLLHVPASEMRLVLAAIKRILNSGGLFFWGQYGGDDFEGTLPTDNYEPKRFFSLVSKDSMLKMGEEFFRLERYEPIDVMGQRQEVFHSSIWRRASE